jgi:hypothetical protein
MAHDAIDRTGLREYVSATRSAWLGEATAVPLVLPAQDTTTSGSRYFKYGDQVRRYLHDDPPRSVLFMETLGDGEWRVGPRRQCAPLAGTTADLLSGIALDYPTNAPPLKTCWVEYKGHRIEVPIVFAQWRHIYDPVADALVIFTPVFVHLSAD